MTVQSQIMSGHIHNCTRRVCDQRFVIDQTLDELEKELDPSQFFRINRKFIVGIDAIGEIEPYFNNRLLLKLNPAAGEEVIVSRQRAKEFKDWMDS